MAGEYYTSSEKYDQIIRENQLEDHVILHTHFIGDSLVPVYFSAADLIVQPYKSATQSGVTQVAYHFEKPILVTDVGGLGEIVPNGKVGYTVSPRNLQLLPMQFLTFSKTNDPKNSYNALKKKRVGFRGKKS